MSVFVNVDKYVSFDENGTLLGIYNREPTDANYIKVEPSDVETLITGKEQFRHYLVIFDSDQKKHVLKHIYNEDNYMPNINDQIFKLPRTKNNPDLTVTQDIKNKKWTFTVAEEICENFRKNNLNFNQVMGFSITRKNNPNHLHRFFTIDISSVITGDYSIDFDSDLELDPDGFSVYTSKRLESYIMRYYYDWI